MLDTVGGCLEKPPEEIRSDEDYASTVGVTSGTPFDQDDGDASQNGL